MSLLRREWPLCLATLILSALIALHWHFTVDDAYISARYAQHMAAGLGARFNAGDPPAEGFTSPLAVTIQAVGAWLGASPVLAGKVLGVLGALATLFVLRRVVSRSDGACSALGPRHFAVLLLVSIPQFAVHAVSGLETTLFSALLLAAIARTSRVLAGDSQRGFPALACISLLLGLARPEGNIAAAGLWVALLLHAKGLRWRALAALFVFYILPAAAYFAFRWRYFGLPLPLPFYVKASPELGLQGASSVGRFFLWAAPYLGLPFLLGALTGPREVTRAVFAGTLPLACFYLWPEHIMGFSFRFMFPLVPALCAVAAFGIDPLAMRISRLFRPRSWTSQVHLRAAMGFCLMGGMLFTTLRTHRYYTEYSSGLQRAHVRLGRDIAAADAAERQLTVVTADSGAIPFYSGLRAVDSFGLNTPAVALHPEQARAVLLDDNPEYVVVLSKSRDRFEPLLSWEQSLLDSALARSYRIARRYEFRDDYFLFLLVSPSLASRSTLQ